MNNEPGHPASNRPTGHNTKGITMTSTHETYCEHARFIGGVLSDIELLAMRENANTSCAESAAMFTAIQIMASRAQEVSDQIERDAQAAQKQEAHA